MRIYLSGIYQTGIATPGSRSIHMRIAQTVRYPHVLESFHYMSAPMLRAMRRNGQAVFLDSGGYSAFTKGVPIDPWVYADFIRENPDIIEVAANMDFIHPGYEELSYRQLRLLKQLLDGDGLSQLVTPVHHVRDSDDWLRRYLDEDHDLICLGGLVNESSSNRRMWLDYVWRKFLTHADGTPKIKVHGFGLTSHELMFRYPWHSVDSTRWMWLSRYGGVLMDFDRDDGTIDDYLVNFSDHSPTRHNPNSRHYRSLSLADRRLVDQRLEQLEAERVSDPKTEEAFKKQFGIKMRLSADALGKSYGLRDVANIGHFRRAMDRSVDKFKTAR